jgi:hypothetical protein
MSGDLQGVLAAKGRIAPPGAPRRTPTRSWTSSQDLKDQPKARRMPQPQDLRDRSAKSPSVSTLITQGGRGVFFARMFHGKHDGETTPDVSRET